MGIGTLRRYHTAEGHVAGDGDVAAAQEAAEIAREDVEALTQHEQGLDPANVEPDAADVTTDRQAAKKPQRPRKVGS